MQKNTSENFPTEQYTTHVFLELSFALRLPLASPLVQRVELGVGEVARLHVLVAARVDAVAALVADGVLLAQVGDVGFCSAG